VKLIIAGSRDIDDKHVCKLIDLALEDAPFEVTEVVSGAARGVDREGERWAEQRGIPVKRFPADWAVLGRSAGIQRNLEMARYGDALIAIWDGKSRGTAHMIDTMNRVGKYVKVIEVRSATPHTTP